MSRHDLFLQSQPLARLDFTRDHFPNSLPTVQYFYASGAMPLAFYFKSLVHSLRDNPGSEHFGSGDKDGGVHRVRPGQPPQGHGFAESDYSNRSGYPSNGRDRSQLLQTIVKKGVDQQLS